MSEQEKQANEFKEAFALFDKEAKGTITLTDFKSMLKILKDPAEVQILEMLTKIKGEVDISFETFTEMMLDRLSDPDSEGKIVESFKVFDKEENGLISAAVLRHSLTTMGEVLADDEVDEMIQEQDIDANGNVNYNDIIKRMI